ncbi:hypothetical protein SEPCBS57363_006113 [Sporothrix epigloea]|uniref:Uncharacterized protein n=1 Tax=Sporothrix epigloea TaxID=1892477 RepID=A0ABP0E196_9PEZI
MTLGTITPPAMASDSMDIESQPDAATTDTSSPSILPGLRVSRHAIWCSSGSKRTRDDSPSPCRQVRLVSASDADTTLMHSTSCYEERELVRNISAALARRDYDALVEAAVSFENMMSPDLVAADLGREYAFNSGTNKPAVAAPAAAQEAAKLPTEGTKKKSKSQKKKEAAKKARTEAATDAMDVDLIASGTPSDNGKTPVPQPATTPAIKPASTTTKAKPTATAIGRASNAAVATAIATARPTAAKAVVTSPSQRSAAAPAAARDPAKKSWASVAKAAVTTAAATTPEAAWTVVTGKKSTVTVADSDDKILVLKGAKKLPDPRLLRNTINGPGLMHVVAARLSAKGNAVITCASPQSRKYLEDTQKLWLAKLKPMGWKSVVTKES